MIILELSWYFVKEAQKKRGEEMVKSTNKFLA
jgi:hypothetical protein